METTNICIINAQEDQILLADLKRHLEMAAWAAPLKILSEDDIKGGEPHVQKVSEFLSSSSLILLLVSSHLVSSDNFKIFLSWTTTWAGDDKDLGKRIIPILARPCEWKSIPLIGALHPLPHNKVPISTSGNQDQEWVNIVKEVIEIYKNPTEKNILSYGVERLQPKRKSLPFTGTVLLVMVLFLLAVASYYYWKPTPTIDIQNEIEIKSRERILEFFQKRNLPEDIRKTAAIGLCKMGYLEEVKNYSNRVNDETFYKIIEKFIGNDKSVDTFYLIDNLRNIAGDDTVLIADKNIRVNNEIKNLIEKLRSHKFWLESDNLTDKEKRFVKDEDLITKIKFLIDTLNTVSSVYAVGGSIKPKFNSTADNFGSEMDKLINDLKTEKLEGENLYLNLLHFNKEAEKAYLNFIHKEDVNAQIEHYKEVIELIAKNGITEAKIILRSIGENENTALSMRARAIETIGVLGDKEDLGYLLNINSTHDLIIIAQIRAMSLILSENQSYSSLESYNLNTYR